jgi:KaiC/GvpD/RAD55 family RecA-like ATPase
MEGLARGDSAVAIATEDHRQALRSSLASTSVDPESLEVQGQLLLLDAAETLDAMSGKRMIEQDKFEATVGATIDQLAARSRTGQVRVYGEIVDLLWQNGDAVAAVRLESLWNALGKTKRFSLMCGYLTDGLARSPAADQRVRLQHSGIV